MCGGGLSVIMLIGGFIQVGLQGLGSGVVNLFYLFNVFGNCFDMVIENFYFCMFDEEIIMVFDNFVIEQEFSDCQIMLSYQIGDLWFFEIVGVQICSINCINQDQGCGILDIYIDINCVFFIGQNNLNFLQLYVIVIYVWVKNVNNVDLFCVVIVYVKDVGCWGKYSVSVMGGFIDQEFLGGGEIFLLGFDVDCC